MQPYSCPRTKRKWTSISCPKPSSSLRVTLKMWRWATERGWDSSINDLHRLMKGLKFNPIKFWKAILQVSIGQKLITNQPRLPSILSYWPKLTRSTWPTWIITSTGTCKTRMRFSWMWTILRSKRRSSLDTLNSGSKKRMTSITGESCSNLLSKTNKMVQMLKMVLTYWGTIP